MQLYEVLIIRSNRASEVYLADNHGRRRTHRRNANTCHTLDTAVFRTCRAVCLCRTGGTHACARIARSGVMALIRNHTGNGIIPCTRAALAHIGLRARIAVCTCRAVCLKLHTWYSGRAHAIRTLVGGSGHIRIVYHVFRPTCTVTDRHLTISCSLYSHRCAVCSILYSTYPCHTSSCLTARITARTICGYNAGTRTNRTSSAAIHTGFAAVLHGIAACRRSARIGAAIGIASIAVVALLANGWRNYAITTNRQRARIGAEIRIDHIAVVALLANGWRNYAITTNRQRARIGAEIRINHIAVVALLANGWRHYAVAANRPHTRIGATVGIDHIAVIALLGACRYAVAA